MRICLWSHYHSQGNKYTHHPPPKKQKLNIQKTKVVASGPITSWQIKGERMEIVIDFMFLGSRITGDGDCSHEMKRHLLLGGRVGPGALGTPRGIGWRGRWEGGPGWGIHVNPWLINFNV